MPSQGYTADDPSIRRFGRSKRSRCVRARIVMVNNDSTSVVRFSNFSDDFKQTNCSVPLRIERPTMLKWNSRHLTNFGEETADHLLLLRTTFVRFGSGSKTYTVNCCLSVK